MVILVALILVFIAGIINGSFALPTKHVLRWKFENIWLQYAIWAFVILPWLFSWLLVPQLVEVYREASAHLLVILVIGGFAFGIGQVCFALALNIIGLGLGFVLNLGLGILLGFLLPLVVQHPQLILKPFGIITLAGCLLAVIGLVLSNSAGSLHSKQKQGLVAPEEAKTTHYALGVILAIVAGISSSGQNFVFSMTAPLQHIAAQLGAYPVGASIVIWPGFLLCAFIPYAIYMLYLTVRNSSFACYKTSGTLKYYLFAIIMGLFWYGSLICYSKAAHLIGVLGPLVAWPLFMVLIILTSTFWGWRHQEWAGSSMAVKRRLWAGLALLIFAVVVLGYVSGMHT